MLSPTWQSSFFHKSNFSVLLITVLLCFSVTGMADAGVTAFDAVTSINNPIKLKALTKGRFFPEGGRLVEFYIDEKHIGTTLSGGDGYAYLKYVPESKGLKKIKLKLSEESDEALLLVTGKKEKVILIAVEGSLFESSFSFKPTKGAKEAIEKISKQYGIIYLSSLIGPGQAKKWLQENKLYKSVVFEWTDGSMIDDLREHGISVLAIVGSPDTLSDIDGIKKFALHETDAEDVTEVESWSDIPEQLK
jgi:hypothetical protein